MAVSSPSTTPWPQVLSMRQRTEAFNGCLRERLDSLVPVAMREAGIDMWLILCQEDNPDPLLATMMPMDTWWPILQILIFHDRGPDAGVERINLSMVDTKDLYLRPWTGRGETEQWQLLKTIVSERAPRWIGVNIGRVQWAAGGLTHNLYGQLAHALPDGYAGRLTSAEVACTRWLATLTPQEMPLFRHVVQVGRQIIARCYCREAITPGVTMPEDLRWYYWQCCADLGLQTSFLPYFTLRQSPDNVKAFGADGVIRQGDCVVCDVGIRYLGMCSDHQQWAYVLREGERAAPDGLRRLMAECNRLQDVFMSEFRPGLSGNELLKRILDRARAEGVPNPRVYSHSLGHLLHEPGPLIGLPWEQERCPGRGDVKLEYDTCFTMELSIEAPLPDWKIEAFRFNMEEDVAFTREGCRVVDARQTEFYLV